MSHTPFAAHAVFPAILPAIPLHVPRELDRASVRIHPESAPSHPANGHPLPRFRAPDSRLSPASPTPAAVFLLHLAPRTTVKSAGTPHPLPARNSSSMANAAFPTLF